MYSISPFQVVEDPNSSISWEMSSCAIFERRSGVCSGPIPWSEFQELMHRLNRQWESNCMTPFVCQGLRCVQSFCFQVFRSWGLIYLESDVLSLHCPTKWFNGYSFYISCSLTTPATFQNWKNYRLVRLSVLKAKILKNVSTIDVEFIAGDKCTRYR